MKNIHERVDALLEEAVKKLKLYLLRQKEINQSVEKELHLKNAQRLLYIGPVIVLVNLAHIIYFMLTFTPTTAVQEKWVTGIVSIHALSAVIASVIAGIIFLMIRKKSGDYALKVVENIFALYILIFGIALVSVDQYVTTNITPFLVVCTIMGFFILKNPTTTIFQYAVAYVLFFYTIGLVQTEPSILATNQLNGITFVALGSCLSIIFWNSERSAILQNRKITDQQRRLEETAYFDNLTGLANRSKWLQSLDDERLSITNDRHDACILLLDIDYFKRINDQYGHPVGDVVLQQLAKLFESEVGTEGKVARWGGEEFIILLTGVQISQGLVVGERIRKRIEEEIIEVENHQIKITVSIGVTLLEHQRDFLVSYKRADEALYLAKKNGRNRLVDIAY